MSKEIKVGVIGCGAIGRQHIARLMNTIPETRVVAVADYYQPSAQAVAEQYGITCCATGEELIARPEVEAVLVTSADPSHAGYVLECIKAGKFVFCEKPLAQTAQECEEIIRAEVAGGRRLVQVGFMRRYDRGYAAMKQAIESGEIGAPLMIHSCHRNMSQAPGFATDYAVTRVAIHEIDISRWLLNDEYATAQVLAVRQSKNTQGDWLNPQIMMLTTRSGQRIDVEVQTDGAYAYDIQCQVVGEDGTVSLPDPSAVVKRAGAACSFPIMTDWSQRFIEAYNIEFDAMGQGAAERRTGRSVRMGWLRCLCHRRCTHSLPPDRQAGSDRADGKAVHLLMDFRLNLFSFFHALRIAMRAQGILLLFFLCRSAKEMNGPNRSTTLQIKKTALAVFFVCRKMPRGAAHME